MFIRSSRIAASILATCLTSGAAHAALQGRDLDGAMASIEAWYDTDLNITWLADANMNGPMFWPQANAWAANLSFTNGVQVYDNWRLPQTLQPDASCGFQISGVSYGYGCTGSEMGHLFYAELGGTANQPILSSVDPDVAKFANLQSVGYWSATPADSRAGVSYTWAFLNSIGYQQNYDAEHSAFLAFAVSPGDVGIAAVPEPSAWAMLLVAGLGLAGVVKRQRLA